MQVPAGTSEHDGDGTVVQQASIAAADEVGCGKQSESVVNSPQKNDGLGNGQPVKSATTVQTGADPPVQQESFIAEEEIAGTQFKLLFAMTVAQDSNG